MCSLVRNKWLFVCENRNRLSKPYDKNVCVTWAYLYSIRPVNVSNWRNLLAFYIRLGKCSRHILMISRHTAIELDIDMLSHALQTYSLSISLEMFFFCSLFGFRKWSTEKHSHNKLELTAPTPNDYENMKSI